MKLTCLTAFVLICWLPGCSSTATVPAPTTAATEIKPEVSAEIDTLLGLIRDRLSLMHDVARWKWREKLPIADVERERVVIGRAVELAREHGLDEKLAEQFMATQIEAGKQIQQRDFAVWKSTGGPDESGGVDLAKELRPKIDQLSSGLVKSLSRLAPHLDDEGVQREIQERATRLCNEDVVDARACATAIGPLLGKAPGQLKND